MIPAMKAIALAGASLLLMAGAGVVQGAALDVRDGWVTATVPGQPVAAAYMTLGSTVGTRVVGVRSDVSRSAHIHRMSTEDGVMRMRRAEPLDIPAGRTVTLAPGALHLMLSGLERPLSPGDSVGLEFDTVDASGARTTAHARLPVRKVVP